MRFTLDNYVVHPLPKSCAWPLQDFGLSRLRSSVLVTQNPEVGTVSRDGYGEVGDVPVVCVCAAAPCLARGGRKDVTLTFVLRYSPCTQGPYMAPECFDVYNTAITAKAVTEVGGGGRKGQGWMAYGSERRD